MASSTGDVTLVANTPTMITATDCTNIRVQLLREGLVRFKATPNTTTPSTFQGGVNLYNKGDLIPADLTLAALFPEVTTPVRLWAYSDTDMALSFAHD